MELLYKVCVLICCCRCVADHLGDRIGFSIAYLQNDIEIMFYRNGKEILAGKKRAKNSMGPFSPAVTLFDCSVEFCLHKEHIKYGNSLKRRRRRRREEEKEAEKKKRNKKT